jgi:hypothetical protein
MMGKHISTADISYNTDFTMNTRYDAVHASLRGTPEMERMRQPVGHRGSGSEEFRPLPGVKHRDAVSKQPLASISHLRRLDASDLVSTENPPSAYAS